MVRGRTGPRSSLAHSAAWSAGRWAVSVPTEGTKKAPCPLLRGTGLRQRVLGEDAGNSVDEAGDTGGDEVDDGGGEGGDDVDHVMIPLG